MIKVLQVNSGDKTFGGGSAILLNIYRNIDHSKVQFDFLTPNVTTYGEYRNEIEDMGGHVYDLHANYKTLKGLIKYIRKFLTFLNEHEYDIVHINSSLPEFNCLTAVLTKCKRCCKVVAHSHNNYPRTGLRKLIAKPVTWVIESSADVLCACSKSAAYAMFGRKIVDAGRVHIIKNGINTKKYAYDEDLRDQVRKELGIENCFVVGNVARFEKQKNHLFLLEVFEEIHRLKDNALLLLVGEGSLQKQIKNMSIEMGLGESVLFLGERYDVEKLYQAMDLFCLPSLFEGLPVVLIEAQTSGLKCYINKNIAEEVNVTNLIHRLSLNDSSKKWANEMIEEGEGRRRSYEREMIKAGFDICNSAKELTEIYMELVNE